MKRFMAIPVLFCFLPVLTARAPQADLIRLANDRMTVEIDRRTGALYSVREAKGRFDTNYFGNPVNNPATAYDDPAWTGNVVSTTWELDLPERPIVLIPSFSFRPSGRWRQESTGRSADTVRKRRIKYRIPWF